MTTTTTMMTTTSTDFPEYRFGEQNWDCDDADGLANNTSMESRTEPTLPPRLPRCGDESAGATQLHDLCAHEALPRHRR
eukprot:4207969-Heterocapsa_arctica.AAC.1